ncbi:MAG: histidinol-phosphatase, partial [Kiritimatiellae bacterium]|nr:histidinol-phosphatase [Kiritimatiellia bacterium]
MKRQILFAVSLGLSLVINAAQWYRGNLHMHSKWSDGDAMPEDAVAWYRNNGYQFVCLSDHQIVQTDTNAWLQVGSKKLGKDEAAADL